jgi:hypothetical protein
MILEFAFLNTGKVMVHEWGHLRWGLFDEYWHKDLDSRFSPFYVNDEGEFVATKCGKYLEGRYEVNTRFTAFWYGDMEERKIRIIHWLYDVMN